MNKVNKAPRGRIEVTFMGQTHESEFNAIHAGSVDRAYAETMGAALGGMVPHPDDGYPTIRVHFQGVSPLGVMAAALAADVGGSVAVDEPVWSRLWYCPPHGDKFTQFVKMAYRM